jgi:hypothetical protein
MPEDIPPGFTRSRIIGQGRARKQGESQREKQPVEQASSSNW